MALYFRRGANSIRPTQAVVDRRHLRRLHISGTRGRAQPRLKRESDLLLEYGEVRNDRASSHKSAKSPRNPLSFAARVQPNRTHD
jgi:hypothetical protein